MQRPIVVTGANGQVGRALMALGSDYADSVVGLSREECDLMEVETLAQKLEALKPGAIINAAAYTAVDKAEEEEPKANLINAQAPAVIAALCRKLEIPFVHYSTDYVFNGAGTEPWTELGMTDPLNAYGRSKYKGEEAIRKYGSKHLIFRTSWVYDGEGKNFLNTMLRLSREREVLKVVDDQIGAPTYAPHLAKATLEALENASNASRFPSGIYHLCGGGETSWMGFAKQIFANAYRLGFGGLKVQTVDGIPTSEYPTPAMRPENSRLDCTKARQVLGVSLPHWEESLLECMEQMDESKRLSA